MATGPLAPCPIRLGGTRENGWPVADHARLALDVTAMLQQLPLAVLAISVAADGTASIDSALSRAGTDVSIFTVTYIGSFHLEVTLPATFTPPGSRNVRKWRPIWGVVAESMASYVQSGVLTGQKLTFLTVPPPFVAFVEIFGDADDVDPHDYGADEDKIASTTEGEVPYAYWQLQELIKDQGSAFSTEPGSLVMMENLVEARLWGLGYRLAERHAANQTPATSGQAIYRWAKILGVQRGLDSEWQLRKRCVNKQRFRATGTPPLVLNAALESMFGDSFVGVTTHLGTIDTAPTPTYWPGGIAGPAALDLGPGTWMSDRARITVSLRHLSTISDDVVAGIANKELPGFLRGCLPGGSTWDWSFDTTSGFLLGTSVTGRASL